MSARVRLSCLAALLTLAAGAPAAAPPAGDVLEEFEVCREGGPLIVPVTIGGKSYPFLVDTGATASTFDLSLRPLMGAAAGEEAIRTPDRTIRWAFAMPPAASVGRLPLPRDRAMAVSDLAKFREVLGVEVAGLLGMDFLSRHALHLDLERGRLRLLRSGRRRCGESLPLTTDRGVARVEAHPLDHGPAWEFDVDTGYGGPCSGGLPREGYRLLEAVGRLHHAGQRVATSAAGSSQVRQGRLDRLGIGPFEHRGVCFQEDVEGCRLGLTFWAHYDVTFDFPAGRAYLRRNGRPVLPDALDGSGLRLLYRRGRTVVEAVAEGSPSARADIRKGDEVLAVAGRQAGTISLPVLGRLLCGEGRTVRVVVRRGEAVREVPLRLEIGWRTAKGAD